MSNNQENTMPNTVEQEQPVVRENYKEDQDVETPPVTPTELTPEDSPAPSETDLDRFTSKADTDFDDLFQDDESEIPMDEDGPTGEATASTQAPPAAGSQKKDHDSATRGLYDADAAKAATEKARRHAMDADGAKTTALVEATTSLVDGGQEVVMDDLDWLNEEDDNYTFEDLFPAGIDEELALEDGTETGNLALGDIAREEELKEEIKTNAFEEGLERLKRKRPREEMTPQEAEDKMEDLICKMTTAADEDGELIRKNMAKERLSKMCDKAAYAAKKNMPYLGKKENNQRFQKLYKYAQFVGGKDKLRSYFDDDDKFDPKLALKGTRELLARNGAQPAISKVKILKHCVTEINKPTNQEWFVTFGGLSVIRTWLSPSPDGHLPALSVRTAMLDCLKRLPVTQSNLKKSKLGLTIKEITKREDENLKNRKTCQDLINRWLALVLDQETSIRRHRSQQQHEMAEIAQPTLKRLKSKQQTKEEFKKVQERRHPEMFQKPSHNFKVQPKYDVQSMSGASSAHRQTRKGKVGKLAGELRSMRPSHKHEHVSVSGTKINLTF